MCEIKTRILRAHLVPLMVSLFLIIVSDALGQVDVHRIQFMTTKNHVAGRVEVRPFDLWAMVFGDGINSVQVTSPTNITAVGELEELPGGGGWVWIIDLAEDYATLRWLRRDFPIGYYKFTFNKGESDEDSVMVYTDPVPPTGFANITYPANRATNVPVTPTFIWDSCLGYGDSLFVSVEEEKEESDLWQCQVLDIGETSWTPPDPLLPGRLHDFEVAVQTGATQGQTLWTDDGDPLVYHDVFEWSNEVLFTVVPESEEKIVETLEFFDDSVADETLVGEGSGALAEYRLNAFRNMLESASSLISRRFYGAARQQLGSAYRRCDGQPYPADLVTGEATEELAGMILDVVNSLPE